MKTTLRSSILGATVIASVAWLPVLAFAQPSATTAADHVSKIDAEKRAVAHPPVDAAGDTGVAPSLPISAPPVSDPAASGHKAQSPTPDAPLPKPY